MRRDSVSLMRCFDWLQSQEEARVCSRCRHPPTAGPARSGGRAQPPVAADSPGRRIGQRLGLPNRDRKSTRLNSSHLVISYAVFCLKKKKTTKITYLQEVHAQH